ncbi:reverse transcriptase [Tanacetum coccineum]
MNQGRQANQFRRLTKVEFPKFQGDDALLWHRQFLGANGDNVGWDVYKNAINQRFGSILEDPMSALKNAKYDKSARDYQDLFDTLLCRVIISPEHAIKAYSLTTLQEVILEAVKKKSKPIRNANVSRFGNGGYYGNNNKPSVLPLPASSSGLRPKPNTPVNKYALCHKCIGQLYTLVVLADEEEEYFEAEEGNEELNVQEELPQISLNALNGSNTFRTIRMTGKVGKHNLHILVDCGSTHNFLDDNVAKKIGCQSKSTCPLAVTVGGGKELINNNQCKGFMWQLQEETFVVDMMILPLGGCEMVLGI